MCCFVNQYLKDIPTSHIIDHLHTSLKEFIKVLIAVTSRLDAVVACINVLHPMENQ